MRVDRTHATQFLDPDGSQITGSDALRVLAQRYLKDGKSSKTSLEVYEAGVHVETLTIRQAIDRVY